MHLAATDLTTHGGSWMATLEPDVDYVPNYKILGYTEEEIYIMN